MSPDLEILAKTVYGESRSESFTGKLAVAFVVMNRSKKRNISPRDVCLQAWQFSCWNATDPNLKVIATVRNDDQLYLSCLAAAVTAFTRSVEDPTKGATNYHTVSKPPNVNVWPPAWSLSAGMVPTARIGAHQFYRED